MSSPAKDIKKTYYIKAGWGNQVGGNQSPKYFKKSKTLPLPLLEVPQKQDPNQFDQEYFLSCGYIFSDDSVLGYVDENQSTQYLISLHVTKFDLLKWFIQYLELGSKRWKPVTVNAHI